jgi:DNA-binding NarL/FixJ family response regulator
VLVRHDPELAAEVLGATEALRAKLGAPIPPVEAPDRDAAVAQLGRRLSAAKLEPAWLEARVRSFDSVVDRTIEALDGLDAAAARDGADALDLTPREVAVLELLVKGHTNREIASALYISPSTAGVHVSNILRKLGAKRRVDAAGIAHRLGLLRTR